MEYSVIEITEADSIETLLQIISDKSLWEEIASTYGIDTVRFWERHEENEIDYYFETSDLEFNLKTLRPCENSMNQDGLDPALVSRIKKNPAYQKFSRENISFSNHTRGLRGQSFDLTTLQDELDYYFNLEYDDRLTSNYDFFLLSKQERVKLIRQKHQDLLNNCKGLRYNI